MIDEIITDILKAEGWDKYTNRPSDRGGPTKWGVTLKSWEDYRGHDCTEDDIKQITEAQAREFYETKYILAPRFNHLPEMLRAMVIDCGVNHGPSAASKWVQRAVGVKQDGVIGPFTLTAVQDSNVVATYTKVCASRFRLYGRIVTKDETQAEYAHGWNNRGAKWLDRLADYLSGA